MSAKNVQFKISIVKYLKLYIFCSLADQLLDLLNFNFRSLLYLLIEKNQAAICHMFTSFIPKFLVFYLYLMYFLMPVSLKRCLNILPKRIKAKKLQLICILSNVTLLPPSGQEENCSLSGVKVFTAI